VDPLRDIEIIGTELILADLDTLEKSKEKKKMKRVKEKDQEAAKLEMEIIDRTIEVLLAGKPASTVEIFQEEFETFRKLNLISGKPFMYVCNVNVSNFSRGQQ
jgi:ribosome-binding ATPase YchF (GTP1/OBG family)